MKNKNPKPMLKLSLALVLLVLLQFLSAFVFAQNGIIRGAIYEEKTGEPLYGVSVLVKELSTGAISDFDGKFELQVAPGTYTIQISYISYSTIEMTSLTLAAGEVKVLHDLLMKEDNSGSCNPHYRKRADVGEAKCSKRDGWNIGKHLSPNWRW
jgi:uncharacterized membrane protein